MTKAPSSAIESLSFEAAMQELEQIVRQLEEGRVPLQEAVKSYERGASLKSHCENLLKTARTTIEEVIKNQEGKIVTQPSALQEFVESDDI